MSVRLWPCFVPFAIAASCGGVISGSDGGSDAGNDSSPGGPCNTSADCVNGGDCAYPDNGGCAAHKQCFPPKQACKALPQCACDGTTTGDDCNGGAQKPIAHSGACTGDCASALACEVCDVTGFSVSPMGKPESGSNQCTQGDISAFVTACLSNSATQQTCSAWQKSDAGACGACILTTGTIGDVGSDRM